MKIHEFESCYMIRVRSIKTYYMTKLLAVFALLFAVSAHAMTQDDGITEGVNLITSRSTQKITGNLTPNGLHVGLKVAPVMYEGNNQDYTLIGILGYPFAATHDHVSHVSNYRDVIGVQGSVFKASGADAVGLKCSIYDNAAGGTSTCLIIDFPYPQEGTQTAGVIMRGSTWATGLIGFEVENPQSYKFSFDFNGSKLAMGRKAGITYCLKFNTETAELDYLKNCGEANEEVIGQVAMADDKPKQPKPHKPKR